MNARPVTCLAVAWLAAALGGHAQEIRFTSVPPIGSSDNLAGLVTGAAPAGHRVAVYLYVQGWWNKPTHAAPLTPILADGTWTCDITTGGADAAATRIAAFLVPEDWPPRLLSGAAQLPPELDAEALAKTVVERVSPRAFHFSGYDWDVKNSAGYPFGPGPNVFSDDPANVWLDAEGRLHLRITHRDGGWQCAEVISRRSFGHGTYRFYLDSAVDALDPNAVLGLFTWSDEPESNHREIDVEVSRWGNATDTNNAQYVIQPFDRPGNLTRWRIPPGLAGTTHGFKWEAGRVSFQSHEGSYAPPPATPSSLSAWTYEGIGVPPDGDERVHLNLWLFRGDPPASGQEVEVVLSRFVFVPLQPAPPEVGAFWRDADRRFHVELTGWPQLIYRFEGSTDLRGWTALESRVAPEARFEFVDADAAAFTRRFFRVAVPEQ